MVSRTVFLALSREWDDFARRLARLQEVSLCPSGEDALSGPGNRGAIMALQDLDRLTQEAFALRDFTRCLGEAEGADNVERAITAVPLRSVAMRLKERLG